MDKDKTTRSVISWALYDWANSAYATTVMAGFFPIFFKQYWSAGTDVTLSTFHLGSVNSVAAVVVAILAPILGYVADKGGAKKKFLLFFLVLGVAATGALGFVAKGDWPMAIACYALATIGFAGGNIFYDSLLISVTGGKRMDFVSALGYGAGYLGGGILFAVNVWMTLSPGIFGLADAAQAAKTSFITVAVWWAFFSIPLFLFVQEPTAKTIGSKNAVTGAFRDLRSAFDQVRKVRVAFLFLIAYWLYIDGVDTTILMAVDYGLSLGFDSNALIVALLITQFVGFPAAIAFGKMGEKIGTKKAIFVGLGVYVLVAVWGFFMKAQSEFFVLASCDRAGSGRGTGIEPVVLRQADAGRQCRGVLRFLQHAGEVRCDRGPLPHGMGERRDRKCPLFDSGRYPALCVRGHSALLCTRE